MGVFVHQVVVIRDFPEAGSLVRDGEDVEELVPLEVGLKADNVLSGLLVIIAEQDLRVVLVLNEELHGRLDEGGDGHVVWVVVSVHAVEAIAFVVDRGVVGALGAEEGGFRLNPFVGGTVLETLTAEAMSELDLKHLDARLFDGQVGHLDVKTVEVDTVETLVDSASQFAFTDHLNAFIVVARTTLVELTEKDVKFVEGARVSSVGAPEATGNRLVLSLELIDDFVEIPGESKHVGMLLLRELGVDA